MKLKALKCPNCDAKLKIKPGETHGTCSYCDSEFILEDEVIKIKHEIVDDTSLEIAETTLNKFKQYKKAEYLYRGLLYEYAHKEEVYIGLIRCITHDFKKDVEHQNLIEQINDYWQKYTSLTTKTNTLKYSPSINEVNRKFWLKELKRLTENFTKIDVWVPKKDLEHAWEKYTLFSEEKEYVKIETKYKDYLKNLTVYQAKKRKQRKIIYLTTTIIALVLLISYTLWYFFEVPLTKDKTINTSEIYKYCDQDLKCENDSYIENLFYPTIAKLKIKNYSLDKSTNTLTVNTKLTNSIKSKEKEFKFKVVDNSGPYINYTKCQFTDTTEEMDLSNCISAVDYTDGKIDFKDLKINKNKNDFKTIGDKTLTVTAIDKDKNKSTKDIKIEIIKTPIELTANIPTSLEITSTATLSYEITPEVSNKEVTITYDNKIIEINDNVITPKKIGTTSICLVSNYDDTKVCKELDVTPQCKNSYTFNFDGSKDEKITAGIDFCVGTYKIYATVLNRNSTYSIAHRGPEFGSFKEHITITKWSPFNEEGSRVSIGKLSYLDIDTGITSITLTK